MAYILKIFSSIGARGGVALGNFLLPLLIANYYSLEELGVFATILSSITFFYLFLKFGMDKALMREVSKLENVKGYIGIAFKVYILILVVLSLIVLIINFYINLAFGSYVFYILLTSIPFTLIYLNSTIIQALSKPDLGLLLNPGLGSLGLCIILYFYHNELSLDSILTIYSTMLWLLFTLSLYLVYRQVYTFKRKPISKYQSLIFLKSSFVFFVISLFIFSQQFSLTFTLNYFESLENVGIIRYVEKISLVFTFPLMIVVAIFSPRFSHLFHSSEKSKLRKSFSSALKVCLISSLLLLIGLIIFFFTKQQYVASNYDGFYLYAVPFIIAQIVNLVTGPSDILLGMAGKEGLLLKLTIITGSISIISFYLFLLYFNLLYAVWILNIVYMVRNILQLIYSFKLIKEN